MSQWGTECRFKKKVGSNDVWVSLTPHLRTSGFAPATLQSTIDMVVMTEYEGGRHDAAEACRMLSEEFVGRAYGEWPQNKRDDPR